MEWRVPYMWKGSDVWIIGGGPSITSQFNIPQDIVDKVLKGELPLSSYSPYMSAIHDKHVIGINVAFKLGNWVDVAFFGDLNFYGKFKNDLASFKGLRVTMQPRFMDRRLKWIKVLQRHRDTTGISNDPGRVCWNSNSGAAAISIAANAGAKRIILVGFDMKSEKKRQWFHGSYNKGGKQVSNDPPYDRHLRGFIKIKRDADKRGIEIINACPDSAITQFQKCNVSDLL